MKFNGKSMALTAGLLVLLGCVMLVEISIFISGPSYKYKSDIEQEMKLITTTYKDVTEVSRDVFYYTTYVGEDKNTIVWFNEKGKVITSQKKKTLKLEEVKRIVKDDYGIKKSDIRLGYGYDNPVYVIESKGGKLLLDYDTLKEVYYLKEGES